MENKLPYYCWYTVAFIDILGQKSAFKENGKYIDDIPEVVTDYERLRDKISESHSKTVGAIENLRESFQTFFSEAIRTDRPHVFIPEDKKEMYQKMRKTTLKIQRFSDSILAFVPLSSDKNLMQANAINGIFSIFVATGGLLTASLAIKKPFRAGIEVGIGTEIDDREVYGPVLYRAYELENKIAQYPRIVIGNHTINYLNSIIETNEPLDNQAAEDLQYCKDMAKLCKKMFIRDLDGCVILDFLGEAFLYVFNKNPKIELKNVFNMALEFVKSEYSRFKSQGDRKLALRYYLLYNYFESRKKLYE